MHSLETKTPHTALCNLEILFTGNGTSKRAPSSLVLLQRLMSLKYCWLALVPPNSRQWPLGFMHHTYRRHQAQLDLDTFWGPEMKDLQELKKAAPEGHSFSKMTKWGPYTLFLLLFLTLFSVSLCWKNNALVHISQPIANGGNLSDSWMCLQKPRSVQDNKWPWLLSSSYK